MKEELERECDDISNKIDEIMRTELMTFDKLKDMEFSSMTNEDEFINSDTYVNRRIGSANN